MAKAKVLNTTVHISDSETGETRLVRAGEKLSAADRKELETRWGKNADQFFEEVDDGGPEDMTADEAVASGHPPASEVSAVVTSERVDEAMEQREKVRTDANPAGVDDSSSGAKKNPSARK